METDEEYSNSEDGNTTIKDPGQTGQNGEETWQDWQ